MQQVNVFTRYYKSITDFKFSNQFMKEKTGKTIGLLFFGYFLFILIFGGVTVSKVAPFMSELKATATQEINKMPDFEYSDAQFKFADGSTYYEEHTDGLAIIVDSEQAHDISYYDTQYDNYVLIKDGNLYIDSPLATPLNTSNPVNKDTVLAIVDIMVPAMYFALIVGAVFGIVMMFFISSAVWGMVLIMNALLKKGLTSSECYRVAGHAMTLPGIVMLIVWTLPFDVPMFLLVYLLMASFYAYQFMEHYQTEDFEINTIYEKE